MKIFVLGSTGMLGRYVAKYFKSHYEVIEFNRKMIDAAEVTPMSLETKLRIWGLDKGDVIINCIGTIKPQIKVQGELKSILINSVFPRILANVAEKFGAHLIHPTTDCVYSGLHGSYTELSPFDVNDVYGMTKALGEPENATCIRTSIIGEEVGQARSLVEWIKSNKGTTVNGYTNHIWNGMTCLEFARVCHTIITTNWYWKGVRHIFGDRINKKNLVEMISSIYNLNVTVMVKETDVKCDRTLSTNHSECYELRTLPLNEQIFNMKAFSETLYS